MNTRSIRLLGQDALVRAREAVAKRISDWAVDWCVDGTERVVFDGVRIPVASDAELDWSAIGPGIEIYMARSDESTPLGTLLLAKENDMQVHNQRLLDQLADFACTGLAEAFGVQAVENDSTTQPSPWLFEALAGSIIADFKVGSEPVQLLLPPAVVDALVPRNAPAQAVQLESAGTLVGDQSVALEISLDLGQLTLEDLRDLQPGDCVATNVPLDASFRVQLNGKTPIARCRLGRVAEHRAVIIEERETGE